ncbi:hypothetical protein ACFPES_12280 [Paenibacillus sp. GCM10023248]|uniref:hypothetical protein n=1 Tax=Bacillales TaxID=1385 RepID=UPI002378A819|nr:MULTISPECIES: hypothetical protein [Bacillales]MDD9267804.1 hypothetical protein [Paenibacillus sp. MAHUQ-63]MDR6882265.1 hypothetical protein [Bacillus sp. 3255]
MRIRFSIPFSIPFRILPRIPTMLLLALTILLLSSCGSADPADPAPPLTAKTLQELYPGDLTKVDAIEIRSGSTGELKSFTDPANVQQWINQVRDTVFQPDPNQEDRAGFLYAVSLLENKQVKFSFTPNSTGGHYYLYNEQLTNSIRTLFESK